MRPDESIYPADWLRIPERDRDRVERALRDGDAELAGFCLQQAVEKFLKAFLFARGWRLRRIHDLEALLDDAVAHDASLEQFRAACQEATKYYMLERYPFAGASGLAEREVRDSFDSLKGLMDMLRNETR